MRRAIQYGAAEVSWGSACGKIELSQPEVFVARITRKELKTDKFALEVGHTVDFFEEHQTEIIRYGAAALAVAAIVVLLFVYRGHQHTIRQEALAKAIAVQEAPVGQANPAAPINFPTQEAKDKEATKVFSELASKYSGSDEGYIAEYYLGCIAADQGKMSEADKHYSAVADDAGKKYASLAKLSLGQVYFAEGKTADGEKTLRSLMDNPTVFVSKDQAALVLAKMLAPTKPAEARKLLDPLRVKSGPISQAALQAYAELPSQ
jgi:predicted negative regulator of RcsB-dependent stress response